MALIRPGPDNFGDLVDELRFAVGVVVRPEPEARVRTEIAEDLPLAELRVHGLELGCTDGDGAAAPGGVARAADLESASLEQFDQQLGLPDGVLADALDADLLDQVVTGRRRVESGDVRRAREKASRTVRVLELGLETERPCVRLPAGERRLEHVGEIRTHVEPAVSRPAAE